jgi:hypothetical protein
MKFPLKNGREVEIVRPYSFISFGQEEIVSLGEFECADGTTVAIAEIDGDKLTGEHARWFMKPSKDFNETVSKAYLATQNHKKLERD